MRHRLAYDYASSRRIDADGRLHVSNCPISKEMVCRYRAEEIPGWQALGLTPGRVYDLFRPGEELQAAAATFNNIPLLDKHLPVNVANHRPEAVCGSTGSDAAFDGTFLRNSLVVWTAAAIGAVDTGESRQLSSAYRYDPIMQSGSFRGQRYDGRMANLTANHLALVPEGRCGADVIIGDARCGAIVARTNINSIVAARQRRQERLGC